MLGFKGFDDANWHEFCREDRFSMICALLSQFAV